MDEDKKQEEVCDRFVPHPVRKLCNTCRRPLEEHPLAEDVADTVRKCLKVFAERAEITFHPQYAWTPSDCPVDRLDEYFEKFPDEEVPRHGSVGQRNRLKRLAYQIPLPDVSREKCRFLDPKHHSCFDHYAQKLQKSSLDIGNVREWAPGMPIQCPKCLLVLEPGELVVTTAENGGLAFHPACFVCFRCGDYAGDLIHCSDVDGTVFCLRHYAENTKKRCHTCDELIFSTRYALAGDKFYHREHLLCFGCDELLEGDRGYSKEGEIYCAPCYEAHFCVDCTRCQKRISVESKHVTFKDKTWHHDCFVCSQCGKLLSDTTFEILDEAITLLVCTDCYLRDHAPKCEGCREAFESDSRVVTYEEKVYHVSCFKCADCLRSIGTGPFIPHRDRVYCKPCHLRNFGVRCFRCKYAITDDRGVMVKKQPYHESCFTCCHCQTNISNRPFKTVEDKWYCLNCYAARFCRECHFCEKPILLGVVEDVSYSYKECQWHASCFVCALCQRSLEDEPFVMRGKLLVCKPCCSDAQERKKRREEEKTSEEGTAETEDAKSDSG